MRYTQNWFEITARDNFNKFLEEFKGKDNLHFLEIGCFEGMGTRWLLENILTGKSDITVMDTFEGSEEHTRDGIEILGLKGFKENVKEYLDKVKICKGYSQQLLKSEKVEYFDFIYVDGSHRACDALQDMCFSWDLLKEGGIMIMDDYAWNGFSDHLNACIAIDSFLNCFKYKYELLLKEYQVVIRKGDFSKLEMEEKTMIKQFGTPPSDEWFENIKLPRSWDLIRGRLDGKSILDIGCNSGWVAWWAKKEGAIVTASDIFNTHVHPSLPFVKCSKEEMPFKNESFDFVLTGNVLHHGELDLTEIKRVLKAGCEFVSLQEPCILNETNEQKYLEENLKNELDLGIDERRPSLEKYKKALSIFSSFQLYRMNDQMFVEPTTETLPPLIDDNYEGGIAIRAIK